MLIDLENPARTAALDVTEWSPAEVLDASLPDDLLLRAIVFRVDAGQWQWSLSAVDHGRGELISSGFEHSAAAARAMATSEIAKCIASPLD